MNPVPVVATLAQVPLPADLAAWVGLAGAELALRRAWPQGVDRLALELEDRAGRRLPGQWFAPSYDAERFERICRRTRRAGRDGYVVVPAGARLLLQAGGAIAGCWCRRGWRPRVS